MVNQASPWLGFFSKQSGWSAWLFMKPSHLHDLTPMASLGSKVCIESHFPAAETEAFDGKNLLSIKYKRGKSWSQNFSLCYSSAFSPVG